MRSGAAMAMGLSLAVALPIAGCGDDSSGVESTTGDGGASSVGTWSTGDVTVSTGYSAVSSYGAPTTSGPWTTSSDGVAVGAGGHGGEGAAGGDGEGGGGGGQGGGDEGGGGQGGGDGDVEICDSGLVTSDAEVGACLGELCCDAVRACTMEGTDVRACIECFEAGGGTLCAAAIVCQEESCPD